MRETSTQSRRTLLRAIGVGGVGLLAGCSGNSTADTDNEDDTPASTEPPTQTSGMTTTSETDEDRTPITTQSQAEFSTKGDDSARIDTDPRNLVITKSDLTGDGWQQQKSNSFSGVDHSGWDKILQNSTDTDIEEYVANQIESYDEVAQAERRYERLSYQGTRGQNPAKSRELDIGTKSTYYFGTADGGQYINYIRVRDANVFAMLTWQQVTNKEDFNPIELPEIGEVAVTMHNKWR